MKTIVFLILMSVTGCFYHPEDGMIPCGYEEQPYYHAPLYCESTPGVYNDECCTWVIQGFYSECVETLCYREYMCGWTLVEHSCYPI
jgi:hypothetical protein